jgi:predicted aconitase
VIKLTAIDRELHDGAHGDAARLAMNVLLRYGNALGADSFVSVTSAHIDSCLYHGQSNTDFARLFVDLGGQVRVPTTLNVAGVDVTHPEWHQGDAGIIDAQRELTELYIRLGCKPTLTCAPYHRAIRPRSGEHIAWAESNAIVFANSVLGAKTDRYGDFADLCIALTGRAPNVGLHRDENRRPTLTIDAPEPEECGLARDVYFACLGYAVGERSIGRVPLINNVPADASEDELKSFGAAAASSGDLALFHMTGITPEAPSGADKTDSIERIGITAADLDRHLEMLCPLEVGDPVAAVCLGTPHFSIDEFRALSKLVDGTGPAAGVELFVSTSRETAAVIESRAEFLPVREFGFRLVVDTCTYLAPVVSATPGAVVTNSAKWAHYGPGNLGLRTGLMSMERCIRSAELGTVASS